MRRFFLSPVIWIALVFALIVLALSIPTYLKAKAVADLKEAINGNAVYYEFAFDHGGFEKKLKDKIEDSVRFITDPIIWPWMATNLSPNTNELLHRLDFLLYGEITKIVFVVPENCNAESLGLALRKFPGLKSLKTTYHSNVSYPEDTCKILCSHIRQIHSLEHLVLGKNNITDHDLLPLQAHQNLKHIDLRLTRLTDISTDAFSSLPGLEKLHFGINFSFSTPSERDRFIEAMKNKLPHAKITRSDVIEIEEF